jgi:hypothetical protein
MSRTAEKQQASERLHRAGAAPKSKRPVQEPGESEAESFYAAQEIAAKASRAYQERRRKAAR